MQQFEKVGKYIGVQNGYAFKSGDFSSTGIPVVKIKNIVPPNVCLEDAECIDIEVPEKLRSYLVGKGDVLISMTGSGYNQISSAVGKVGRYHHDENSLLNQRVGKLYSLDEEVLSDDYLYFFFSQKWVRYELTLNAGGSANQANISPSQIGDLEWILPDVEEQRTIAEILSSLDEKIELNSKQNRTLEAIAQTLFKRWFVEFEFPDQNGKPYKSSGGAMQASELGEIPMGWEVKPLDQIAEYLNGLAMQKYPPIGNEYLPVIKIRELKQGITANSDKASTKLDPKYIVDDGDVLFSWSGSLEVDIWCHGKGALNQHLFKVSSDNFPKWFYYLWTKYHLRAFQAVAAGKATTMGHIQRAHLTEALTVCPSIDELPGMSEVFEPLIEKIIVNRVESRALAGLRDTLLPKLMSGELRVA